MPSANSAKIEKTPHSEASDFIKQCISLVEKKVRNLEKRKAKLDGYKVLSATKELIADQVVALSKYELVVEMLEQSKEIQKNVQTLHQEYVKQAKKLAKREQQERQQHEVQRIKEVLLLQDILNNMGTDEIRQDFLNGANGAIKLSEKELNQLDDLYKLISPDRDSEDSPTTETQNFNELLLSASEHIVLLLDGKNKEVLGSTYKTLKETLMKVNESGYFDPREVKEEETEGSVKDEIIQATETELVPPQSEPFTQPITQEEIINSSPSQTISDIERSSPSQQVNSGYYVSSNTTVVAPSPSQVMFSNQTVVPQPVNQVTSQPPPPLPQPQAALPDVLMQARGKFNFLQESQVDIESPHMDPAVVAAHKMVPHQMSFQPVGQNEALLAVAAAAAAVRTTPSSNMIPPGSTAQPDFDPARPIPTQTFTNQNFAAMQNMMTAVPPPAGYAPTPTVSSAPQPSQMPNNVTMLLSATPVRNISASSVINESPPGYQSKQSDGFSKPQARNYSRSLGNNTNPDVSTAGNYQSSDENDDNNEGMPSYNRSRGGRGGGNRSRGGNSSSNGYTRNPRGSGTGSYSNGRGGSNYYGNRDRGDGFNSNREGYSNNPGTSRRGGANPRGGPRGAGSGRVNSNSGTRGGGSYRSQE